MAVPKINQDRLLDTADRMITRWGGPAVLRRASGDRACTAAISTFSPMERIGQLRNPVDRKALVSAKGLDVFPDQELDSLVTFKVPLTDPPTVDEILKITEPPKQNGTTDKVIYWTLAVRA